MRARASQVSGAALIWGLVLPALAQTAAPATVPTPDPAADAAAAPETAPTPAQEPAPAPPSAAPEDDPNTLCTIDPEACPRLEGPSGHSTPIAAIQLTKGSYHPGEKTKGAIIAPSGHAELAGELVLITADSFLTEEETKLTDVALFRVSGRRSFSDALELYLDNDVLAKQPADTEEPIWQGASVAGRAAIGKHFAAGLGGGGGPLLDGAGYHWSLAPRVFAKAKPDQHLRFLISLGTQFTFLELDAPIDDRWWFQEIDASFEAQLGGRGGAGWVGIDYAVPVLKGGAREADAFDPEVRIGLELGGVLTFDEWSVFSAYAFVDRGELEAPETTLPILDGGFDQRQLTLGVSYRFEPEPEYGTDDYAE